MRIIQKIRYYLKINEIESVLFDILNIYEGKYRQIFVKLRDF